MNEYDVVIVSNTTNTFEISLTDADGNLYNLESGELLIFGIKSAEKYADIIIVKTAQSSENGVCTITLFPTDTKLLDAGRYRYDVGLQSGGNYYNVIPPSNFYVLDNVTYAGCADE